eukprot:13399727-Alexandrium_andersonii.AAC.1
MASRQHLAEAPPLAEVPPRHYLRGAAATPRGMPTRNRFRPRLSNVRDTGAAGGLRITWQSRCQ